MAVASCGFAAPGPAVFEGLDPLQWAREPHATLSHTATMAAESVAAPGGVEYGFECTAGGAIASGWQANAEYQATGLTPETAYTFVAKARARGDGRELLAPSRPVTVTTPPADKHDQRLAEEVELVPLLVSGDKDNRMSIVLANRWTPPGRENDYNKPELREEFLKDARHVLLGLTRGDAEALEPFVTLRNFFNVYALWWPTAPPWDPNDRQNGLHWDDYNALRDRLFLPWQRDGRGWVTHLAMPNSDSGGGGAGRRPDQRVGDAMIAGNKIEDFFHEFSHTAMGLGDKYIGWGVWGGASASGESPVATHWTQRGRVRWRAWIEPNTPVPTPYDRAHLHKVGVFEGATHRLGYIFRATPTCIMAVSQFRDGLCPMCIQRATQRAYEWVDVFDATYPVRKELTLRQPGRARFAIRRVKPEPDTHRVEWRLNGKRVATGTDEVEVDLGALPAYTLTCTVTDETALIRPDPPYSAYPQAETSWQLTNPHPGLQAEPLRVALTAAGGEAKTVTCKWSTGATGLVLDGLADGTYHYDLAHKDGSTLSGEVTLAKPAQPLAVTVAEVIPSTGQNNGQIRLDVSGGRAPCQLRWSDKPDQPTSASLSRRARIPSR
ncbi:MAG: hypothetical protein COZ06_04995 [Armatimonadetes bacterium CG_4_10_14_3_um_filter_66_18]|nr:MAG: hypothetical protein COZ06_04995 [Armatimonadetes bacterium CG_4_10_14_3_um_filter_66_18]